jgi:hypothetical protein
MAVIRYAMLSSNNDFEDMAVGVSLWKHLLQSRLAQCTMWIVNTRGQCYTFHDSELQQVLSPPPELLPHLHSRGTVIFELKEATVSEIWDFYAETILEYAIIDDIQAEVVDDLVIFNILAHWPDEEL